MDRLPKKQKKPPSLSDRLRSVLADESASWQAPLLGVLVLSAGRILYLLGTQETDAIYPLF